MRQHTTPYTLHPALFSIAKPSQEVDGIADATLSCSDPDDVLGPPDARLVKRWSAVGAAASLSAAHHRVLRRIQAMASGGRPGSKGAHLHLRRLLAAHAWVGVRVPCDLQVVGVV